MEKLFEVADYYLRKESMSPKKLQKILYYAYCWYLTLMNETKEDLSYKLFDEQFEAWVHGPVVRKIYFKYKKYGHSMIGSVEQKTFTFDKTTEEILEKVWEVYGHFSGDELESISHQEDPWLMARKGKSLLERSDQYIKDEIIFEYYGSRIG